MSDEYVSPIHAKGAAGRAVKLRMSWGDLQGSWGASFKYVGSEL